MPLDCCCFKKKKQEMMAAATPTVDAVASSTSAKLPFCEDLRGGVHVGTAIRVGVRVLPQCSRFAVDLICGKSPNADIAFHLNPRLLQRYVVRNSLLNGQWGQEEKSMSIKFPFDRNKSVTITILAGQGEFFVDVDGHHLCTYKFRTPLTKITGLRISGDVDVTSMNHSQLESFPRNKPPNITMGPPRMEEEKAVNGPLTVLLPGAFQPDWQLEIYGRVKILPHSFYINLQEGYHRWPHPKIPLHLNPRFGTSLGESVFVRNAWIEGGWGQEERTPGFQFSPGSPFTIAIRRGNDHFSVWIDGKLAGEFKFRTALDKIDTVHIQGDVVVYRIGLDEKAGAFAPLELRR